MRNKSIIASLQIMCALLDTWLAIFSATNRMPGVAILWGFAAAIWYMVAYYTLRS